MDTRILVRPAGTFILAWTVTLKRKVSLSEEQHLMSRMRLLVKTAHDCDTAIGRWRAGRRHGSLMAWDTLREVSGRAGAGTAGDVPLAEQAGHLKYLVQVLVQSHTLRLCGGVPQKLFPAGQKPAVIFATRKLLRPRGSNPAFCTQPCLIVSNSSGHSELQLRVIPVFSCAQDVLVPCSAACKASRILLHLFLPQAIADWPWKEYQKAEP